MCRFVSSALGMVALAACQGRAAPEAAAFASEREAAYAAATAGGAVRLYSNLGSHQHPVTTRSPLAQRYFDQGLRLTYGFNHGEAVRAFRAAARLDPGCAMCAWGEALALGPNINAAMDSASGVAAHRAVRRALDAAAGAGERERAYIRALAQRYGPEPLRERAARDSAYARAMAGVAARWPEDDDAAVLAAEAWMLLTPWDYWTAGREPRPNARAALELLERVLARNPDHAGACHFFIHAVEAAYPERAVPCAERLPRLMPGAGHIVHMPAHIYIRVGRYADAIEANVHAVHADEAVLEDFAPDGAYQLGYYPHNYHFLWFAATMAGRGALALEAARSTASRVKLELVREPGLGALQHYLVTPLYALVRFGRWDEVLMEPAPPGDLAYPMGVWHYARALALVARGRVDDAEAQLRLLRQRRADPALREVSIWDLNPASALLEIAESAVAAEIALRRGDPAAALRHLEQGVRVEDGLVYDEPPTWHLPVRHQLGAALLAAGRPADAERAYRADLERHPENGWSLLGLAHSLRAQGRREEARTVDERFRRAWRDADVALTAGIGKR